MRTSMWIRWFGECVWLSPNKPQFILVMIIWKIYIQKSATKNSETIVRCNQEVGQRTDSNLRHIRDRLATKFLEKDDFVNWPSSSVVNSKILRIFRLIIVHGQFQNPVSAWKEKIGWFVNSSKCTELDRIDGEPMEFEWKIFPGFTTLQILAKIQNMMTET